MNIDKNNSTTQDNYVVSLDKKHYLLTIKFFNVLGTSDILYQLPDILKQASNDLGIFVKDYYIIVKVPQNLFHGFCFEGDKLICLYPNESDRVKVLRLLKMHKNGHIVFDSVVRQFLLKYNRILNINDLEKQLIGYQKAIFNWLFGGKPLNSLHQEKLIEYFDPIFNRKDKSLFEKMKTDNVIVLTLKDLPRQFRDMTSNKVRLEMFANEKWHNADLVYFYPLISMKRSYCLFNGYKKINTTSET
ncbi:hypothetical protein ACFSKL_14385 [Belliella marina]|uniref:Uncharacterized protein n=1 Tax=Belliella marina TaxID=1644146 RepID=A0ABW4VMU8_9BACT